MMGECKRVLSASYSISLRTILLSPVDLVPETDWLL